MTQAVAAAPAPASAAPTVATPPAAAPTRTNSPWPVDPAAAAPAQWAGIEAGESLFFQKDPRRTGAYQPGQLGGHPLFLPQDAANFTKEASYGEALTGAIRAARATGDRKEAQAVLQGSDGAWYIAPMGAQSPDATGEATIYNDNGRFSIERGAALSADWAGFQRSVNALTAVVGAERAITFDNGPVRPNMVFPIQPAPAG
jgi:hypothetical protein